MPASISIDRDALVGFCRQNRIAKLSLFGSVLRADFEPGRSDVDVLVEFEPGARTGLTYFKLARMRFELEDIFGSPVDLVMADAVDRYLHDDILGSAEVQYVAA